MISRIRVISVLSTRSFLQTPIADPVYTIPNFNEEGAQPTLLDTVTGNG
jgi:hypothetical protein